MVSGQELFLLSPKKTTVSGFMPAPPSPRLPWASPWQHAPVCVCVCVCVCVHALSHVWLVATPWTVALQVPLSMEFSRQEYWSELSFPTPGDLPDPGIQYVSLVSPALAGRFFTNCATWEAPAPVSPGESSGWLLLPPNPARSFPLSQAQRSGASSLKLRTES